jgi:GNAT superfamily N-acetyltransferase
MEPKQETLRLYHQDGREHQIVVLFASNAHQARLGAFYETGCAEVEPETQVVDWCALYEPPNVFDVGRAHLGKGRIDLDIVVLRGIGLGSLLMRPLVSWIKSHSVLVPIEPIDLAAVDAKSANERDMRNRFYEKLGFKFDYKDAEQTWGESLPMCSSKLIVPAFRLSGKWCVQSIAGIGEVFKA